MATFAREPCRYDDPVCHSLTEDRERLLALINTMPDIVCFKDGAGRWLEANESDLRLFRLEGVDYRGKTDAELAAFTHPVYREAFLVCERSDEETWQAGAPRQTNEIIRTPAGEALTWAITKIPLFHPDGGRKGLVVLGRDITAEQQALNRLRHSTEMLNRAQRLTRIGHFELDLASTGLTLSANAYKLFLFDPAQPVTTRDILSSIHPADQRQTLRLFSGGLRGQDIASYEFRAVRADGAERTMVASCTFSRDQDGGARTFFGVVQDITRFRQGEEMLSLLERVFQSASEGVTIADAQGRIRMVNRAFSAITGYSAVEAVGRTPALLQSGYHDEIFYQRLWDSLLSQGEWSGEIWNRRKSGEVYPEWLHITAVRDGHGRTQNYVAVFSDLTETRRQEETVRFARYHDALTNLPNRTKLHDLLAAAIGRAADNHGVIAVLYFDLDNFKRINDSLGYQAGDRLIQEVAARFAAVLRPEEGLARMGGDEFCLFLPCEHENNILLDKVPSLRDELASPFLLDAQEVHLTASLGISLYPRDGQDAEILLRRAEMAMTQSKQQGKNNFRLFTPELDQRLRKRFSLENELRQAVERREILPYYQPRYCLRTGAVGGAEALARWPRPGGEMVMPGQFIPVAEESGIIVPLGLHMLREACRQAQAWHEAGHDLNVSINLSPRQFRDQNLLGDIDAILRETGVTPASIEFEITEQAVIEHEETALAILTRLHALGCRISMDDFGTGYSALYYLKKFPIGIIKIDRSFIMELPENRDSIAIVTAIIAMARSLGIKSLAEGVETEAQRDFLRTADCDEVQGYLFGRPLPADAFAQRLRDGWQTA